MHWQAPFSLCGFGEGPILCQKRVLKLGAKWICQNEGVPQDFLYLIFWKPLWHLHLETRFKHLHLG